MNYSKSSNILLINTLIVTTASFLLLPYLVIGANQVMGIDYSDTSLYLMIALVIGSGASLLSGFLLPRSTLLIFLIVNGAILTISYFFMIMSIENHSSAYYILPIGLVLFRVGLSCTTMITRSIHLMTNFDNDCSKLFAKGATAFGLGSTLGPLIGGVLYKEYDFHTLLSVSLFFSILSFFLIFFSSRVIRNDLKKFEELNKGERESNLLNLSHAWPLMVSSVLFFCLLGQSLSFIPIKIDQLGDSNWLVTFFTINAVLLTFTSIPITRVIKNINVSPYTVCVFGHFFIATSLVLSPYLFSSLTGVAVVSILYSIGEILFSIYSLEILRSIIKPVDIRKAMAVYVFLTTSIGIGVGQYAGIWFSENLSIKYISFVWFLVSAIGSFIIKKAKV